MSDKPYIVEVGVPYEGWGFWEAYATLEEAREELQHRVKVTRERKERGSLCDYEYRLIEVLDGSRTLTP